MTTIFMLTEQSRVQMMSFILRSDDHLVVIDGGNLCDADYLTTYVRKLGGHIDGWFLTHAHSDHVNAFSSTMERHWDEITLDRLYFNFPSDEFFLGGAATADAADHDGGDAMKTVSRMRTQLAARKVPVTTVHRGDVFTFGEMTITVLREPDESITENRVNNSSCVYRLDANGKSCMFLGDLGVEGGRQLLELTPPELMKCDIVQLAHHGQAGVDRPVYDAIDADYCFWCTPKWLWDNDIGCGYDTHNFKTIVTRGWMSDIGVRWHYLSWEGTQEAPMDDLDPTVHMVKY